MDQRLAPAVAGKFITTKEAADLLRKHHKTLDKWRHEGRGPRWYQPDGPDTHVYYLEHEVIAFVVGKGGVA